MWEEHLRLYKSLNKNKVKYVIIGGVAGIIYGLPRTTIDIDIFIEPTLENSQRLLKALRQARFGTVELTTPQKILDNEINIFNDYFRVDVITRPKGIKFNEIWKRRSLKKFDGVKVCLISLKDLIKSKKASARTIDKEDIKILTTLVRSKQHTEVF